MISPIKIAIMQLNASFNKSSIDQTEQEEKKRKKNIMRMHNILLIGLNKHISSSNDLYFWFCLTSFKSLWTLNVTIGYGTKIKNG